MAALFTHRPEAELPRLTSAVPFSRAFLTRDEGLITNPIFGFPSPSSLVPGPSSARVGRRSFAS